MPTVQRFQDLYVQVSPSSTCALLFPSIADLILTVHLQIRLPYMAWHEIKKTARWRCLKLPSHLTSFGADSLKNTSRKEFLIVFWGRKQTHCQLKDWEFTLQQRLENQFSLPPSRKNWGFTILLFPYFFTSKHHLFTHFVNCTVGCDIRILATCRMFGDLPTKLFSIHG